jgi:cardiolipin synthase A/B
LVEASWWVLTLAFIGLMALVTGILTLFFSLGRRPARIWIDELPPVDSEDFLQTASGLLNAPLMRGGSARLLINGERYFPRMLEVIAGAEQSINFMVYIWELGRVSDSFFEALV